MKSLLKIPRAILVLILLFSFGLLRGPYEDRLREKFIESHLILPPPGHTVLYQMKQSALLATLGGLRPIVAVILELFAFDHWSNKEWTELMRKYSIITNLEPRDETHWVSVIWHVGINATASVQTNNNITEFERKRLFNLYTLEAVKLAENGLKQIPDSVPIRKQLSEVYREKLKDYCETARIYKEMQGLPGCPSYAIRFHGYFLAKCPGKEQEAYDYLMNLYRQGERHHTRGLFDSIRAMENALSIPTAQRIPFKKLIHPAELKRQKKKRNAHNKKLPGGIIVP